MFAASSSGCSRHLPQALDDQLIDENALLAADFPLAEATLGRNADLADARLPGQVFYFHQQFFQLYGELPRRHEKFGIEHDEEVCEIADVTVAHSRTGHQAERLDGDGEAIAAVLAERKNAALDQCAGDARRRSVLVYPDNFG